jgi:hypothetical protein
MPQNARVFRCHYKSTRGKNAIRSGIRGIEGTRPMRNPMIRLQDPKDPQLVIEVAPDTMARVVDQDTYLEHGVVVHLTPEVPVSRVRHYLAVEIDTGFEDVSRVLNVMPDPYTVN